MKQILSLVYFFCSLSTFAETIKGEELYNQVAPVVVAIQHEHAGGSGFIISEDGYILTNGHVVSLMDPENPKATARRITVELDDESRHQAKVIGFCLDPDVALLKIDVDKKLPMARIGNAKKVKTGQVCYAFGAPLGLKKTFTRGIISNTQQTSLDTFTRVFQMDAIINPGNSGGPLFNEQGEVIGINTYGGKAGLGFSIPVHFAMHMQNDYRRNQRFVRSDVPTFISKAMTEDFARAMNLPRGIFLDYVEKGSPADLAGFKSEDVIVKMNAKELSVLNEADFFDWVWNITIIPPGTEASFEIVRREGGQQVLKQLTCTLIEDEPLPELGVQLGELEEILYPSLGLGIQRITKIAYYSFDLPTEKGVRVTNIMNGSPAANAFIRNNDVITHVDKTAIVDEEHFKAVMDAKLTELKRYLVITAQRGNSQYELVMRPVYRLRSKKILIVSNEGHEFTPYYKRQFQLFGAEVQTTKNIKGLKAENYDAVLFCNQNNDDETLKFINAMAEAKKILGVTGEAPLILADSDKFYSEKKVTMSKNISSEAITHGLKYTGEDVEKDGQLVSSTEFDQKIVKNFIKSFTDAIFKKH